MSEKIARLDTIVTKEFQKHLRRLSRRGGEADFVYQQVIRALDRWEHHQDAELRVTKHGESRLRHITKYDLKGFYRLVVYEHAGKRIPLMVGDHDDVDRWLESNRGRDFTVELGTERVQYTIAETNADATKAITEGLEAIPRAQGPVLDRLPPSLLQELHLTEETIESLKAYATFEEVEDSRVWILMKALPFPTEDHRQVVLQAVAMVARGEVDQAVQRIKLLIGGTKTATEQPQAFSDAVEGDRNSDAMVRLSDLSTAELDRINKTDGFTDWMLYLHPDQKQLVHRRYNGPARLLGVSGSGKTSVLVHRANALAKLYPGQKILVLTLNPALARLIQYLLDCLCLPEVRPSIEVHTIYEYCYNVVKTILPNSRIEMRDPRSGETLENCWADFMEKEHARASVGGIVTILEERETNIGADRYILDELIWIRSGFGREQRADYLTCDRPGRGIHLPKHGAKDIAPEGREPLPSDTRERILTLLADYEEYMGAGGLLDEDGVSLEAFSVKHRIGDFPSLRARCVLVDEVQDCSTVELAVIKEVPNNEENGLFLTGDPVQKVFAKQHDLVHAGINIVGRAAVLRLNYRNTRQILDAAFSVIDAYKEIAPVAAADVLVPEFAAKEGPKPKLYECKSREDQARLVFEYLSYISDEEIDTVCICSASEDSLQEFATMLAAKGFAFCRVRGSEATGPKIGRGVKLAVMRDIKGYEFSYVFLVDLIDSVVYPAGMPWDERWRVAFQIYVAMTRARLELHMTFINNRSYFLGPLQDKVDEHVAEQLAGS